MQTENGLLIFSQKTLMLLTILFLVEKDILSWKDKNLYTTFILTEYKMDQQNLLPAAQSGFQPQVQQSPPQQPPYQLKEPGPEKKKNWKIWVITILVIIIAVSLGFYFLLP